MLNCVLELFASLLASAAPSRLPPVGSGATRIHLFAALRPLAIVLSERTQIRALARPQSPCVKGYLRQLAPKFSLTSMDVPAAANVLGTLGAVCIGARPQDTALRIANNA